MNPQELLNQHATFLQDKYGDKSVFAVMLYGSQNYRLETPTSDVDSKAIVLPSFNDFALKQKWLSVEHEVAGGLTNVKDVRAMFENFLKSNVNFLECLYTDYLVVLPEYKLFWDELVNNRDLVANSNPLKLMHAAAGMAAQKYFALTKPFESKAEVLARYGYDPKQLHHLLRLNLFMENYLKEPNFGKHLVPYEHLDGLRNVKANPMPLEEAQALAEKALKNVNELMVKANNTFEKNPESAARAKDYLNCLALRLLKEHLKEELLK